MVIRWTTGLVTALALCAVPLPAQESQGSGEPNAGSGGTPAAQLPVFRAQSDLVVLHVNVFDGRSDAVGRLPQSAFEVFEDGVRQRIEFFSDHTVPVATGLVIDNSSSMLTRRPMLAAGARAFAATSHESDEMFTIVFNEHVRSGLPDNVPFTHNRAMLEASFQRFPAGGMTALHDAVIEGLAHLEESSNQKRVLVILSDGEDNASRQPEKNMLYRAARSNALIYTIWTGDVSNRHGNPGLLRKLARENGGVAYRPETEREVVDAFGTIADNIRRVYSIGYVPTNSAKDGTFRRVKVLVHASGRQLRVRARDGYMAPDHDGGR
jgi:VWFA-related protein